MAPPTFQLAVSHRSWQQRVKRLESENGELRRQVEVAYGQLYEPQFKRPVVETQPAAAAMPSIDIKA